MFAAIDLNEILITALGFGVIGAIGGGLMAYLTHKPEAQQESQWEQRERARIQAQMNAQAGADQADTAQSIPVWFFLIVILAIIVGVLVANPSLVALLPAGRPQ